VCVAAVGLNRAALKCCLYPGDAGAPGSDCAVVAVGGAAPALRAGDAAFGLATGACCRSTFARLSGFSDARASVAPRADGAQRQEEA